MLKMKLKTWSDYNLTFPVFEHFSFSLNPVKSCSSTFPETNCASGSFE